MKHVVAYIDNPGSREIRAVREIFGVNAVLDPVLPFVSPPMDEAAVDIALKRLPDGFVATAQPREDELPRLQTEEVVGVVRRHPEWLLLLGTFGVHAPYLVEARELSRCWVVLVHAVADGIPPGEGFIVDKCSQIALPRRFVDVMKYFRSVPPQLDDDSDQA